MQESTWSPKDIFARKSRLRMKITSRGTVYSGKSRSDQSLTFPGICALPGGRWLSTFRAAPNKNSSLENTLLTYSDDEGKSWSDPVGPWIAPRVGNRSGAIHAGYCSAADNRVLATLCWLDRSDPTIPMFNTVTEGLLDMKIMLSESQNRGQSWSEPCFVDSSPFYGPVPITGPILPMGNGKLLCQFEINKPYYDTTQWRHFSVLKFSDDDGQSWPEHVVTSNDPTNRFFYWDQRPSVFKEGWIFNLYWSYDNKTGVYVNIHARESRDNGRTWSQIWDTGVPGQPAAPALLEDGRIVMVYVDRTSAPTIKARISSDQGRTWPEESVTTIYEATTGSQAMAKQAMQDAWEEIGKYSVGLPAIVLLPDGHLLVVYYAGQKTDDTNIEYAIIEPKPRP